MSFETVLNESVVLTTDSGSKYERNTAVNFLVTFQDTKWRHPLLQQFIWDNLLDTALSAKERAALGGNPHSALVEAAKNLRLSDSKRDPGHGSELAEALLYGLLKHHYGALPVVPKIFHKQNTQDNAKGADSVHIVIRPGEEFELWLGEAKFYSSIDNDRLAQIVTSVGNSLQSDKLSKENSLICNLGELADHIPSESLLAKVRAALSPKASIDELKPRLHVPILFLYECTRTAAETTWCVAYQEDMKAFHKDRALAYFGRQVKALADTVHLYQSISFHALFVPVPSKADLVERFISNVKHFKQQAD